MLVYNLIEKKSLDSTNTYAKELLNKEFLPEGSLIITITQNNGRGNGGNSWESESGKNLTGSFVLYPLFLQAKDQFILNMSISLAVYDFVKGYIPESEVKIKWPNDIYIDNKKVAGLLIENSIQGSEFCQSIAGIGININQEKFTSDAPNPVSLINITKHDYNISECVDRLFLCLAKRYTMLENELFEAIRSDYMEALYRYNDFSEYIYNNKKISAKINGIGEMGMLQLLTSENILIECDFKQISFVI
jgi:BirA family biotin operon repressor/biotin-[acetyl-CoA-carboxylase] ligase